MGFALSTSLSALGGVHVLLAHADFDGLSLVDVHAHIGGHVLAEGALDVLADLHDLLLPNARQELVLAQQELSLVTALLARRRQRVLRAAQVHVVVLLQVQAQLSARVHARRHAGQVVAAALAAKESVHVVVHLEAAHAAQHPLLGGLDHQAVDRHHLQAHLQHHVLHAEVGREARHLRGALLLLVLLRRRLCRRTVRSGGFLGGGLGGIVGLGRLGLLRGTVGSGGVAVAAPVLKQVVVVDPALAVVLQTHLIALRGVGDGVVAATQARRTHHFAVPRLLRGALHRGGGLRGRLGSNSNLVCMALLSVRTAAFVMEAGHKARAGVGSLQGVVQLQGLETLCGGSSSEVVDTGIGIDSGGLRNRFGLFLLLSLVLILTFTAVLLVLVFLGNSDGLLHGGRSARKHSRPRLASPHVGLGKGSIVSRRYDSRRCKFSGGGFVAGLGIANSLQLRAQRLDVSLSSHLIGIFLPVQLNFKHVRQSNQSQICFTDRSIVTSLLRESGDEVNRSLRRNPLFNFKRQFGKKLTRLGISNFRQHFWDSDDLLGSFIQHQAVATNQSACIQHQILK
eukprot:Colp12_sorted_trinity150504_noHs@2711